MTTSEQLDIEQAIIEATNFIPEKKYRKRQDYLGALLRAVCDLPDPDFEKLPPEAKDWNEKAAEAHSEKRALPDFNGVDHDAESGSGSDLHEHQHDHDQRLNEEGAVHAEQEGSSDDTGGMGEAEKGKPKKKVRTVKTKVAKPRKEPKEKAPSRGVNQWGVANRTKSDLVCRMLAQEGGTTMKDIIDATGHAHYNLCNRLQRHGYTIKKEGLNWRLMPKE